MCSIYIHIIKLLGTCLLSTTVKVVGTVAHQWVDGFENIYPAFKHTICLWDIPYSVTVCLRYRHEIDHGIHYVSVCRTSVFFSQCTLSYRTSHNRRDAHMDDHRQSTCRFRRFFIQYTFFSFFSLDATLKRILLGVVLSWFRHHPGYYTTIDFWFGLEHPLDAKSSVISQMSVAQCYMFGVYFIVSVRCVVFPISTHDSCHACWAFSHVVYTMSAHTHFV